MKEALALIRAGERDGAHQLVQEDSSSEGAYLHGVIHRDEGDYSNARYWFSRARLVAQRIGTDPMGLTDAAERGQRDRAGEEAELNALEAL